MQCFFYLSCMLAVSVNKYIHSLNKIVTMQEKYTEQEMFIGFYFHILFVKTAPANINSSTICKIGFTNLAS